MNKNEKMAAQISAQLGLKPGRGAVGREDIERLERQSDAQLAAEIVKIREQLKRKNISVEKQKEILRSLMPMMDDNQKARLSKIIELLSRS